MDPYVRFYDFVVDHTAELALLQRLALLAAVNGRPARILECGGGTGRLALALAAEGHKVTALERSPDMRQVMRTRLESQPPDVQQSVTIVDADFISAPLDTPAAPGGAFDLAIFSSNTLCVAAADNAQTAALWAAGQRLRPGGILYVEQFNPSVFFAEAFRQRELYLIHQRVNPDTGRRTARYMSFLHDAVNQHLWATTVLEEFVTQKEMETYPAGSIRTSWVEHLRYNTLPELRLRLEIAGFDEIRMDGGYEGEPADNRAMKLVVTARTPNA